MTRNQNKKDRPCDKARQGGFLKRCNRDDRIAERVADTSRRLLSQ